jgi:hypothetical protein
MNTSNNTKQRGYVYRQCPLDAAALHSLMTTYVLGEPTYAFAANSIALKPIYACSTAQEVQLVSERTHDGAPVPFAFGHVFSPRAEVRWKRREDHTYDALVLTENEIPDLAGEALTIELYIREPQDTAQVGVILRHPKDEKQYKQLAYVEYVAANGAVQFVRYLSVK